MVAGALDLDKGTQPPNPASGDGRLWIDGDGNVYVLEDDGTNTALGGGGSMSSFTLAADSGTAETVADSDTVTIAGGTGIDTVVSASDTVTVAIDSSVATLTGTQTLTNKTLTTPTIADLSNATHDHADAAGGGTLALAAITDAGTMASQDANAVNIDGGNIDGTAIGGATAAAGTFTDLTATGTVTLNGIIDGGVGATDNAVPRANGTGGSTLQASSVVIDDSNNVSGVAALTTTSTINTTRVIIDAGLGGQAEFRVLSGPVGDAAAQGWVLVQNGAFADSFAFTAMVNGSLSGGGRLELSQSGVLTLSHSTSTPATWAGSPQLWNASGELTVKDGSGNVTTLSPHPTDTLVDTSGRVTTHVYKEVNAYTGRRVELDIVGALMALEASTGNIYIYEDRAPLRQRENKMLSKYKQKRRAWRERSA